jgi:succinyl-CoA synthetase beta subunit
MNLHEFQAKKLFRDYGIAVPKGIAITSAEEIESAIASLPGDSWVVKAQVHAGGRGKGGGVKLVHSRSELDTAVDQLLGSSLVTPQTTPQGLPVNCLLIETLSSIKKELYLSVLVDRTRSRIMFMLSPMGGMDIESVAADQPDQIFTVEVNPVSGLLPYQSRMLAFSMGLSGGLVKDLSLTMSKLYCLFIENDLSLIEINPLVITEDDSLLALDAKINLDENALFRHSDLETLNDPSQQDEREYKAKQHELNYVTLDGNIGCMVNGAGLAMATMDLIKIHGGQPANFLDVGGGITAERVVEAFKLVTSDTGVKAILVNIFGGIVRCDLIAAGIIEAIKDFNLTTPVVVRLEGTNMEEGRNLLEESGLEVTSANDLADAASKVVKAAREAG